MNHVEVLQVNAFTDPKFPTLGNPAGVVFLSEPMSQDLMSKVAQQAAMPITAFVIVDKDDPLEFLKLRYYDLGGRECHICGHATVATTHALITNYEGFIGKDLNFKLNPVLFGGQETNVQASVDESGRINITLPGSILEAKDDDLVLKNNIARALGIGESDIKSISFSTNIRDFVVGLNDSRVLEGLRPNFEYMKSLAEKGDYQHEGLMVSALSDDTNWDIKVRVFLPITGVNEDIACGSGNCSIIPYWYQNGLHVENPSYKTVFPYPEDPDFLGGVQGVTFDPEKYLVTINCEAQTVTRLTVDVASINATGASTKQTLLCNHM